jgi:hypothetical protein
MERKLMIDQKSMIYTKGKKKKRVVTVIYHYNDIIGVLLFNCRLYMTCIFRATNVI